MRRSRSFVPLVALAALGAAGAAGRAVEVRAQEAARAAAPAPAPAPFFWRIDGRVPSYLFGTIHVPDERVLALAGPVEQAFDRADAVYTEIPLDPATQVSIMGRVLLPGDKTLSDVIGAPLAARLAKAVERALSRSAPKGTAAALTAMLNRMQPWAAMSQLPMLEFLPDMFAGRQALDAALWTRAQKAGKALRALETVDEQLGTFERFTLQEQTRMLELALDEMEKNPAGEGSPARLLVAAYLSGDSERLMSTLQESMGADRELYTKVSTVLLDERNVRMADRILERLAQEPQTVHFFAVGAAHYPGPRGIVSLLEKKGLTVTRVR